MEKMNKKKKKLNLENNKNKCNLLKLKDRLSF